MTYIRIYASETDAFAPRNSTTSDYRTFASSVP
jgi:hypothetical protein